MLTAHETLQLLSSGGDPAPLYHEGIRCLVASAMLKAGTGVAIVDGHWDQRPDRRNELLPVFESAGFHATLGHREPPDVRSALPMFRPVIVVSLTGHNPDSEWDPCPWVEI